MLARLPFGRSTAGASLLLLTLWRDALSNGMETLSSVVSLRLLFLFFSADSCHLRMRAIVAFTRLLGEADEAALLPSV